MVFLWSQCVHLINKCFFFFILLKANSAVHDLSKPTIFQKKQHSETMKQAQHPQLDPQSFM